jgi:hypothetical protein
MRQLSSWPKAKGQQPATKRQCHSYSTFSFKLYVICPTIWSSCSLILRRWAWTLLRPRTTWNSPIWVNVPLACYCSSRCRSGRSEHAWWWQQRHAVAAPRHGGRSRRCQTRVRLRNIAPAAPGPPQTRSVTRFRALLSSMVKTMGKCCWCCWCCLAAGAGPWRRRRVRAEIHQIAFTVWELVRQIALPHRSTCFPVNPRCYKQLSSNTKRTDGSKNARFISDMGSAVLTFGPWDLGVVFDT